MMTSFKFSGVVAGAAALIVMGLADGAVAQPQKTLTLEELRERHPAAESPDVTAEALTSQASEPASDADCLEGDIRNPDGSCDMVLGGQRGKRFNTDVGGAYKQPVNNAPKKPSQGVKKPSGPSAAQLQAARRGDLYILFRTGSADLTAADRANLRVFATFMAERPDVRFLIEGHTDTVGGADYNKELSRRRAMAVHDYLVAQGVDRGRLQPEGFGFERLRDPNRPTSGVNRRVEASEIKVN